jgi:DNA-binding NarL/FixJ family response regulator
MRRKGREAIRRIDSLLEPARADRSGALAMATDELGCLTQLELRLSLIVGRGATNKEASAALCISAKTVEAHLHRIYVKLGIRSRTELACVLARGQLL